jgi:hypothetical protein
MKFNVTPSHFEQLLKQSYSLDHIFLLKLVEANIDIQPLTDGSMKIAGLYQSLVRKGLISDVTQEITQIGRELLTFADSEVKQPMKKLKQKSSDFDAWWNVFPSTDNFEHNGKKFSGSRGLKRNREECRIKFNKILSEGDYTADDIVNATLLDVFLKKEASVKNGDNRMSYIQNSFTYISQRSFEPFLEMIKTGINPLKMYESTTKRTGSTDI